MKFVVIDDLLSFDFFLFGDDDGVVICVGDCMNGRVK